MNKPRPSSNRPDCEAELQTAISFDQALQKGLSEAMDLEKISALLAWEGPSGQDNDSQATSKTTSS